MRIFTVSDLHIDYPANAEWLFSLDDKFKNDILILAGDISDSRDLLSRCFEHLSKCFHKVLYVPGNHDIWVHRDEMECSLEKFYAIQDLAQSFGVHIDIFKMESLTIVPLLGWYDYSFSEPGSRLEAQWMDYYACKWPAEHNVHSITELFTEMNKIRVSEQNDFIISFSHFLPRIDVMPSFIPQAHRFIYPVLGSTRIEQQIRQLGSDIHIYGHSHVNRITRLDGITYINNAFGTPSESRITNKELLQIWDSKSGLAH